LKHIFRSTQDKTGKDPVLERRGIFVLENVPFIAASPDYIQTSPVPMLIELKTVTKFPPDGLMLDAYRYQVRKLHSL
jgi:hypothetical protein